MVYPSSKTRTERPLGLKEREQDEMKCAQDSGPGLGEVPCSSPLASTPLLLPRVLVCSPSRKRCGPRSMLLRLAAAPQCHRLQVAESPPPSWYLSGPVLTPMFTQLLEECLLVICVYGLDFNLPQARKDSWRKQNMALGLSIFVWKSKGGLS